jgi:hypothetical protein
MVSAVAAMALLSGLPNIGTLLHHNPDQRVEQSRVMGWRLEVTRDSFANTTVCKIDKSAILYKHGVVTFQLGHGVNTANAQFRVDDGPARDTSSVALQAAGLGAVLRPGKLPNPSDGAVNIPAAILAGARQISIRSDSGSGHRNFNLSGLSEALEVAKGKNCDIV